MARYDIASLERLLENAEHNDAEAHKLYNNLGLAHFANRDFRQSLKAHREEKKICKRLLNGNERDTTRHLDLAIAYRRCGDAMIKLNKVIDNNNKVITSREQIIRLAQTQHEKGLKIAKGAPVASAHNRAAVNLEKQAASAALGQAALTLALLTKKRQHFIDAALASVRAARQAERLVVGHAGLSHTAKQSLLLGIALNHAIALSELGEKKNAKNLLHAVAVRAIELDDQPNIVRALSNLGEEASEEGDWTLCATYVREWARIARREEDGPDEADALRKLAVAQREVGDLRGAEESLQKALSLPAAEDARNEAKAFLSVVQQDIEEYDQAQYQYASLQRNADKAQQEGDYAEEAKHRLKAGNCAFILRKTEKVVEILERYFELVDHYGCDPVMTEVDESTHNAAIANMGESMWKLKRFEDAVKWATRELSVYDGDLPGQAQAWCNLGVYLDDLGKKEKALDALKQSISIAKRCGEIDTMKRAEENLHLVEQELYGKENEIDDNDGMQNNQLRRKNIENLDDVEQIGIAKAHSVNDVDDDTMSAVTNRITPKTTPSTGGSRRRSSTGSQKRKLDEDEFRKTGEERNDREDVGGSTTDSNYAVGDSSIGGEKSIIMVSTQAMKKSKLDNGNESQRDSRNIETSTKQSAVRGRRDSNNNINRRSSGGATSAVDRTRYSGEESISIRTDSTKMLKNLVDLPREYRAICSRSSTSREGTTAARSRSSRSRPMIISAFREVASELVSREACEQLHAPSVRLNLRGLLVDSDDVHTVFETLATIPAEHDICVDLSLNPVISPSAYDARKLASHAVKQLDLSCAGIVADTVRKLAEPLAENGSLGHVSVLNLSKNSLGRHGESTAIAVARLISCTTRLRSLDLSLNMLSNTFLTDMTERLGQQDMKEKLAGCSLTMINLCLNNRRAPTGLLETQATQLVTDTFSKLFERIGTLEIINVRACGANLSMRRALRQLNDNMAEMSRSIVTVSDENLDEDI